MTNLTQDQTDLLRQAAQQPDGAIDAPQDAKVFKSLIKQGLMLSMPRAKGGSRLIITDAGRAALPGAATPHDSSTKDDTSPSDQPPCGQREAGECEGSKKETTAAVASADPSTAPKPNGPSGKLGLLVALLKSAEGATVQQMSQATGWQVHSVRGAMAGSLKKKLGLSISSEKTEAGRIYRIAEGDQA